MKKLKLNLDEIKVESFETLNTALMPKGTINGYGEFTVPNCGATEFWGCVWTEDGTCFPGCASTKDATCLVDTCGGLVTACENMC